MEKLILTEKGNILLPEKYEGCRHLTITTPYTKRVIRGQSHTFYFRHKNRGDKPYIEDGFISIKETGKPEERFEIVDESGNRAKTGGDKNEN